MVEDHRIVSAATREIVRIEQHKAKITVFHCYNAIENLAETRVDCDIKEIPMPCSSMTREVFLLRAFESGADAVVVIACTKGACHYIEGNIRAGKRVERTKKLLGEIGIDGRRLNIHFIERGDKVVLDYAINQIVSDLAMIESNL